MLKLFFWLGLLVAAALLGQQILEGTGYLLLVLPNGKTSIQMSFWLGVGLLLASWLALVFLLKLLSFLSQPLVGIKRQLSQKKLFKTTQLTLKGLENLALGNWKTAEKQLAKAAKKHHQLISLIAAAHAAYLQGKIETSAAYLQTAEQHHPKSKTSIELSQIRMLLDHNQQEQALASLVRLHTALPKNKLILRLLAGLRLELKDFEPLIELLPQLKKYQALNQQEFTELETSAYEGYFNEVNLAAYPEKLSQAKAYWHQLPSHLTKQEELIMIWLQQLVSAQQLEAAEQLLTKSLKNSWSAGLITQLGLLPASPNCKKHLVLAQSWLKKRPNDAALLHCLGRISQKLQQWEEALDYYLASHKIRPQQSLS